MRTSCLKASNSSTPCTLPRHQKRQAGGATKLRRGKAQEQRLSHTGTLSRHMCSKSQQWPVLVPVTMSQIMERWPWPKANTNMKNECQCGTEQVSTSLNKFKQKQQQPQQNAAATTAQQPQHGAAVKLILWPSNNNQECCSDGQAPLKNNFVSEKTSAVNFSMDQNGSDQIRMEHLNKKPSRNKMWSKLPLRQIPSSLSAKMGWLGQIILYYYYHDSPLYILLCLGAILHN